MNEILTWLSNAATNRTFLIIGVVSLALLLISFVLDGIFDGLDIGGDGILSLTTLGAFGAIFGFTGFAARGFGASAPLSALLGAIIGLLGAIGSWGLSGIFKKSSSSASESIANVVGRTAVVSLRIPGGEQPGEISYLARGFRNSLTAYAHNRIPAGTSVKIISIRGENSVEVELAANNLVK